MELDGKLMDFICLFVRLFVTLNFGSFCHHAKVHAVKVLQICYTEKD